MLENSLHFDIVSLVDIFLYICKFRVYTDRFLESFVGIYTGRLYAIIRMMAIKPNAVIRW